MILESEYYEQLADNRRDIQRTLMVLRKCEREFNEVKGKAAKQDDLRNIKRETDRLIGLLNRRTFLFSGVANTYEPQRPVPSLFDSFKGLNFEGL